jgi:hypothetical protein
MRILLGEMFPYVATLFGSAIFGWMFWLSLRRMQFWSRLVLTIFIGIVEGIIGLVLIFLFLLADGRPRRDGDEFKKYATLKVKVFDSAPAPPFVRNPSATRGETAPNHLRNVAPASEISILIPKIVSVDFGSSVALSVHSSGTETLKTNAIVSRGDCHIAQSARNGKEVIWNVSASREGTCDIQLSPLFPSHLASAFSNPWQAQIEEDGRLMSEEARDQPDDGGSRDIRQTHYTRTVTLSSTQPTQDSDQATIDLQPTGGTIVLHLQAQSYSRISGFVFTVLGYVCLFLIPLLGSGSAFWIVSNTFKKIARR